MDDVLVTGAFGRVGTALIEHLDDEYDLAYLNKETHEDYDAHVADVTDSDAIRPAFDGRDAVVHLAAEPSTDADWQSVFENNVLGTYNVVEAARDARFFEADEDFREQKSVDLPDVLLLVYALVGTVLSYVAVFMLGYPVVGVPVPVVVGLLAVLFYGKYIVPE